MKEKSYATLGSKYKEANNDRVGDQVVEIAERKQQNCPRCGRLMFNLDSSMDRLSFVCGALERGCGHTKIVGNGGRAI